MDTDVEKRLERIERMLREEEWFARVERRSIRITAFILLILILALLVIFGVYEAKSFVTRLFPTMAHLFH
jgi:hypothetical protein